MTPRIPLVLAVALPAPFAYAQFAPVEDLRSIDVTVEMELTDPDDGMTTEYYDDQDDSSPPAPFGPFDGSVLASVNPGGNNWAQALGVQDSSFGDARLDAAGWVEAQGNLATPVPPSHMNSAATSMYTVRFEVDEPALIQLCATIEAESPSPATGTDALARVRVSRVEGDDVETIFEYSSDDVPGVIYYFNLQLEPGVYEQEYLAQASVSATGGNPGQAEASYTAFTEWLGVPCSEFDIAAPTGVLDLNDIAMFIGTYAAVYTPLVDFAPPFGVYDLSDIQAFIVGFMAGCD